MGTCTYCFRVVAMETKNAHFVNFSWFFGIFIISNPA